MTNQNPTSGNTPGLPALIGHMEDMQTLSLQLTSLIQSVNAFQGSQDALERCNLVEMAMTIAERLNRGLDIITLHEVAQ